MIRFMIVSSFIAFCILFFCILYFVVLCVGSWVYERSLSAFSQHSMIDLIVLIIVATVGITKTAPKLIIATSLKWHIIDIVKKIVVAIVNNTVKIKLMIVASFIVLCSFLLYTLCVLYVVLYDDSEFVREAFRLLFYLADMISHFSNS